MAVERLTEEELNQAFEGVIEAAERLPDSHATATKDAGYMHHVLSCSYPRYSILYLKAQEDTFIYQILTSCLQFLRGVAGELKRLAIRLEKIIVDDHWFPLGPVVKFTGSFGKVTDLASVLFDPQSTSKLEEIPAPLPRRFKQKFYKSHLRMNSELLESYDQVWQIYNGTSADRHRDSLLIMRQVFDHFFCFFAPDDRVRESAFWEPKKVGEPDQIFLSERIDYTAALDFPLSNVSNELSDALAGLSKLIINLYESSIKMDKQCDLDEVKAHKFLQAMDSVLKDWIETVLIPFD